MWCFLWSTNQTVEEILWMNFRKIYLSQEWLSSEGQKQFPRNWNFRLHSRKTSSDVYVSFKCMVEQNQCFDRPQPASRGLFPSPAQLGKLRLICIPMRTAMQRQHWAQRRYPCHLETRIIWLKRTFGGRGGTEPAACGAVFQHGSFVWPKQCSLPWAFVNECWSTLWWWRSMLT